jgi:uncharacterized protein (DUF3084 family)
MTAQKQAESAQAKLPTGRKPWKKKTPVEVVLDQIDRVKQDVAEREEELKQARRQLQKLEDARKLLESA